MRIPMKKCALIAVISVSLMLCADRVTFNGKAVQPSFGSVAGVWFWSCGDAQLLLLGFEGLPGWRAVACGAGWALDGEVLPEGKRMLARSLVPERAPYDAGPVRGSPPLASAITEALVEWDWRLQDGIGTPREPRAFGKRLAVERPPRTAGDGAPARQALKPQQQKLCVRA